MLKLFPASARCVHEAYALTRAHLEALESAGALVLEGKPLEASALLAKVESSTSSDCTTRLDRAAISKARGLALDVLKRGTHDDAIAVLEALSLAPREVSEHAERALVARAMRLQRLVEVDTPSVIIANEIELLVAAVLRLDSLRCSTMQHDNALLPDDEIMRFADARFALSLGTFAAVIDAVAEFHREERPADGSEAFALGGPLLDCPDPRAELEPWLEWMVMEGMEGLDNVGEMIGVLRADLLEVPLEMREQLLDSIDCALAPFVICDDWIPELDARLVALEDELITALQEGLVIVSRVKRDLAY